MHAPQSEVPGTSDRNGLPFDLYQRINGPHSFIAFLGQKEVMQERIDRMRAFARHGVTIIGDTPDGKAPVILP